MKKVQTPIAIIVLFLLGGCGDPSKVKLYMPMGAIYSFMPKTDNEVYKHGWMDGCESGVSTGFSKEFAKSFHYHTKDVRFQGYKYGDSRDLFMGRPITSEDMALYNRVWFDTYKVCRHYAVSIIKPSSPQTPGGAVAKWDDLTEVYEFRSWSNGDGNIAFW